MMGAYASMPEVARLGSPRCGHRSPASARRYDECVRLRLSEVARLEEVGVRAPLPASARHYDGAYLDAGGCPLEGSPVKPHLFAFGPV